MRSRATAIQISISFAMLFFLCGFGPDQADQIGADFIVTAAPVYKPLAALRGQERFPHGAQLLLVHEGKPELLVSGFAATADANVSFDGKSVLFAGKRNASDPWQVWELALADRSVHQLTSFTIRLCPTHPNRLPVERGVDQSLFRIRRVGQRPRDFAADLFQCQFHSNRRIGGRPHFV